MSTLTDLKDYLLGKDDDIGYLLNPEHNGKTVMLSGAWGSGKTHFWQNQIEDDLTKELNKKSKACVYVSLYGKDNIEAIKNEILFKAYESVKDENKLAKRAISAFGFGSRLLSVSVGGVRANTSAVGDAVEGFFESKKIDEAESFLADGGLICLDDFERKSKHINLNDLFGFISQLAIDMNCKIVIILNSDVFEGEEANVFKTVKEKTVNKFFYFEPTRRELFDSIYDREDVKYKNLNDYREDIFSVIDETEELNARIYIQILDNCLEWIEKGYDGFEEHFRALIHVTIAFIKYNLLLPFYIKKNVPGRYIGGHNIVYYSNMDSFPNKILHVFENKSTLTEDEFINVMLSTVLDDEYTKNENLRNYYSLWIQDNKADIKVLWKYGYQMFISGDIDEDIYNRIYNFIKTGILLKTNEKS